MNLGGMSPRCPNSPRERRLGFSTIACPDYDIGQVIAMARSHGYTGIELRFLKGIIDLAALPEFSRGQIGETRRRIEDVGLTVVAIDTSVRMSTLDPVLRAQQRDAARTNLEIARGLGAPFMRVFGGPLPPLQDRERTLDMIAAGLGEIADMTLERGVTTILETHDDFSTSAACVDLYRRGASDALCILWDTLHTIRHGESPAFTWAQLGPRIRHVHVKDARFATPDGFDFALMGEGVIPIGDIVSLLEQNAYPGFIHFEWEKGWHPEIAGPEVALPHFAYFMAGLHA